MIAAEEGHLQPAESQDHYGYHQDRDENCKRVVSVPNVFYGADSSTPGEEHPGDHRFRKRPLTYNIQVSWGRRV